MSFSAKSWHLPLVISPRPVHLFDFGKIFRADLERARLPASDMNQLRPLTSPPMGPKITWLAKAGPPKSAIFQGSVVLPWLPTVPMDSTLNFNGFSQGTSAPPRLHCLLTASGSHRRLQIFHLKQVSAWVMPQHQSDISWLPMTLESRGNFHRVQTDLVCGYGHRC